MASPAEVSEKRSNFRIRQFKEKRLFNIAANLTFNTMASFVILLIARTARIACADRHTHKTTTVTLSAHARQRLFNIAANLTFNTMASFVILLIARTARIACADRHTHKTTTVTLSAHARRGLINA